MRHCSKSAIWLAVSSVAKLYYEAVKSGKRTLESVPNRWREAVATLLEKDENDTKEVTE